MTMELRIGKLDLETFDRAVSLLVGNWGAEMGTDGQRSVAFTDGSTRTCKGWRWQGTCGPFRLTLFRDTSVRRAVLNH